jgi:enterochelin esterase family protein
MRNKNLIRAKFIPLLLSVVFVICCFNSSFAQEDKSMVNSDIRFKSFSEFKKELIELCEKDNKQGLEKFWNYLKNSNQIPFRFKDSVAFLYKGSANSVDFQGDFNSWGNMPAINIKAEKSGNSDIWLLEKSFPIDARIDYKIVLNGKEWILDNNNPFRQMSGFGPNSELRMPGWKYPEFTIRKKELPAGELLPKDSIISHSLGYKINYRVYIPYGYKDLADLPVIYVTDGHEYSDDEKGSMIIVLDNLIALKKIKSVIAVFVDPREPGKPSNNRRQNEYVCNDNFVKFICDELVPLIDKRYKTIPQPEERAILGTSLGGINSTFFGISRSDIFKLIAIQSPAYWSGSKLYEGYKDKSNLNLKIFLSAGTVFDGEDLTRKVKNDLEKRGCKIYYKVVNEGHSWGNWRALLPEMLIYFWGI